MKCNAMAMAIQIINKIIMMTIMIIIIAIGD